MMVLLRGLKRGQNHKIPWKPSHAPEEKVQMQPQGLRKPEIEGIILGIPIMRIIEHWGLSWTGVTHQQKKCKAKHLKKLTQKLTKTSECLRPASKKLISIKQYLRAKREKAE